MKISCSFASRLSTPEHVRHAEKLGYERAWAYDCTARFSDIWMTLARAAERTERIGLGTAVIVPGYREVMTNAAAIATLEALAPNRVVIAVGSGLGQASQGRGPTRLAELEEYVRTLRGLLRGEEMEYQGKVIKMMQQDEDAAPRPLQTPVLLASEGPKTLRIAHKYCDGVISLRTPRAGENWSAVIISGTVVADDDPDADKHIMAHAGPGAAINYRALLAMGGSEAVDQLPRGREYREAMERHPEDRRHLFTWARHVTGIVPEEHDFLTPGIVRQLTFTGSRDELRGRLQDLENAGATEVIYQVAGPDIPGELEAFAAMAGEYMRD